MFQKLYIWCIGQASRPYAVWVLSLLSLTESFISPIPPDILLTPMVIAERNKAFFYAFICTATSVTGGVIGYWIGAVTFAKFGIPILQAYHLEAAFARYTQLFQEWGFWIILVKGLTPIPFKVVTIASGVSHLNWAEFLLASILARGMRFFLLSLLLKRFGPQINTFLERYAGVTLLALCLVLGVGVGALYYFH